MNTLNAKFNIIKLYFQADKKRIGAVLVLFALFIGAGWMILAPQTLADDVGYYYGDSGWGGDWGYSDWGGDYGYTSYSSPSYDYYYGSSPSYSYDYSTPSASYDYYYGSAPDYDYYDYNYGDTPSSSYDYYAPYSYGDYDYDYYEPNYSTSYDYYYGGWGGGYDYEQNYTYIDTYSYTYDDYYYATSTRPDIVYASYPDLNVYKTVKNVTKGEGAWGKITSANIGDTIAFSIKIASTGRGQANNVSVRDTLPYQFSYITGTTKIDDGYASDNLFSTSGLFLGYIPEGQTRTITFEASITSTGTGYSGTNTYINYAYARGDNIYERSDTAEVVVSSTYTPYTPSTPTTPSYSYAPYSYYSSYYPSYTPSYPSYLPSLNIPSAEAATVKTITGANYFGLIFSLVTGFVGAGGSYLAMRNSNRLTKMKLALVVAKNKLFS